MFKLKIAAACLLLGGCTATFTEPKDSSAPTITIDEKAGFALFKNGEDCSYQVGVPQKYWSQDGKRVPMPLVAGRETALNVGVLGVEIGGPTGLLSESCSVIFSFIPENAHDYFVKFSGDPKACSMVLLQRDRQAADGQLDIVKSFKKRVPKNGVFAKDSYCEPLEPGAQGRF